MSQNITRRGFVASAPAAVAAVSLPVLAAAGDPDAALLALREPFDRTWRVYDAALDEHSAAETSARKLCKRPIEDRDKLAAEQRHADADALVEKTCAANGEVVEQMCQIPACTIAGLAFKAHISLEYEQNLNTDLVTSIMDDILAMGGAHA